MAKIAKLSLQTPAERPLQLFITYRLSALSGKLNEAETALLTGADGMVAKDASIKAQYV